MREIGSQSSRCLHVSLAVREDAVGMSAIDEAHAPLRTSIVSAAADAAIFEVPTPVPPSWCQ
jgi:hypothetical protein